MSDTRAGAASGDSVPADADAETVSLDGGRSVAYAEYGAPDGTPVVFLHGTPGSRLLGAMFDEEARRRGVRLLVPDRPGYGRSPPWADRTLADTGAFVAAVLDDAGVERAGVVGFSGGGPHALAVAATHGSRVRAVDLLASAVPPGLGETPPTALRLLETLAERTPRLLGGLLRAQAWVAARASPSLVVSQYTTPESRGDLPASVAELVRRDFVEAFADGARGFVVESRLLARPWDFEVESVDRPVRVYHGDRDANVPVEGARRVCDRLPRGRLTVFDDADHLGTLRRGGARVLERYA